MQKVQRDLVPKLANEHKAPFTLNELRFLCEFFWGARREAHNGTRTLQCKVSAAGPSEAVLGYEQKSLNRLYCEEVPLCECEAELFLLLH